MTASDEFCARNWCLCACSEDNDRDVCIEACLRKKIDGNEIDKSYKKEGVNRDG